MRANASSPCCAFSCADKQAALSAARKLCAAHRVLRGCFFCEGPDQPSCNPAVTSCSTRVVYDNIVTIRRGNFVTGEVLPPVGVVNVLVGASPAVFPTFTFFASTLRFKSRICA